MKTYGDEWPYNLDWLSVSSGYIFLIFIQYSPLRIYCDTASSDMLTKLTRVTDPDGTPTNARKSG